MRYSRNIVWFTSLIGKKTTFEFMKTYLRDMLGEDKDLILAHTEIKVGQTKRWVLAWKFIDSLDLSNDDIQ